MSSPTFAITLKSGKTFACNPGEPVLAAALRNNISLPHSCRSGNCGTCAAPIVVGSAYRVSSSDDLENAKADDTVLTCCYAPASNLDLDISEVENPSGASPSIIPCRVSSIVQLANDVLEVTLRTPPGKALNFTAGQHLQVIGPTGVRRSYSLAHRPRQDNSLSLHIKKYENGMMSDYWFNRARSNDLLRLEGPFGTFFHQRKEKGKLIMLATGTGIAPIIAIYEELLQTDEFSNYDSVSIYWGMRRFDDHYWKPQGNQPDNFFFRPVASSEGVTGVNRGYVQDIALAELKRANDIVVYACGSTLMIEDARESLTRAGMDPAHFFQDAFVKSS